MSKIKQLSDDLINKIAAGEVVERPASVVKELVENSLDAGATQILVDVKEGGKSSIVISDNGYGLDAEDAELALRRHATSKISAEQDLFSIKTLGFRGEALASIAAVSRLTLTTKTADAVEGVQIVVEGGQVVSKNNIGCPVGTTVLVENLFFNTPARKKHLKTIQTELANITDVVTRYALGNPKVQFKLLHNSSAFLSSPSTTDTLGNIASIYGRNLAKGLVAVNYADKEIEVMGFISKPDTNRADKEQQSIFINGRYVKNNVIMQAVYEAYHSMLFTGRHPVVVLDIIVDPAKVDVNVHPQKTTVRFSKEYEIYQAVLNAVREALNKNSLLPEVSTSNVKPGIKDSVSRYGMQKDVQAVLPAEEKEVGSAVSVEPISVVSKEERLPEMRIIGQIGKTYLIAETQSGMLIIDQHAAEERVNYENFMKNKGKIGVQDVHAEIIELSAQDYTMVLANKELFFELGFKFEDFGNNSIVLRSVPAFLGKTQTKQLFLDMVADLGRVSNRAAELREEALTYAACRASIKAGEELTMPLARKLIERLNQTDNPYTCPHGRPTIINITEKELEKMFKRS